MNNRIKRDDMNVSYRPQDSIKSVIFEHGGVLADEGFLKGCYAIAAKCHLDQDNFFHAAEQTIYSSGYMSGRVTEQEFWCQLKPHFDISLTDILLAQEILKRFVLRPQMMHLVRRLREAGYVIVILSDHTNWLDQLEARDHFFHEFDYVFNSYHLAKNKRDPSLFDDVMVKLNSAAKQTVFIDNNEGNVERACKQGLSAILFLDCDSCIAELEKHLGQTFDRL
jgi:putative hydrolase of the HAD superfamily